MSLPSVSSSKFVKTSAVTAGGTAPAVAPPRSAIIDIGTRSSDSLRSIVLPLRLAFHLTLPSAARSPIDDVDGSRGDKPVSGRTRRLPATPAR